MKIPRLGWPWRYLGWAGHGDTYPVLAMEIPVGWASHGDIYTVLAMEIPRLG
jgi:hypothetical protein